MASNFVECLNCGATRRAAAAGRRSVQQDECPRCGYVGWAETGSLTEALRRALRDHTVDERRQAATW